MADNITTILQDSLSQMAPVVRLQLSDKYNYTISDEAKEAIANRDIAHHEAKQSNTIEDWRHFRHLRNATNSLITREILQKKRDKFQSEMSAKARWKITKEGTGQSVHSSPVILKEGNKIFTKTSRDCIKSEQTIFIWD